MKVTEKRKLFLKAFERTAGNISQSCKAINIDRGTYYNWIGRNQKFAREVEAVKQSLVDLTESKLMELINEKNPTAIIFYLKTQGKDRGYIEQSKVEMEISEIKPILTKRSE